MSDPQPKTLRACPICGEQLLEVERKSIVVDTCDGHGLFFDHGELEALEYDATKGVRIGLHRSTERTRRRAYRAGAGAHFERGDLMVELIQAGRKARTRRKRKADDSLPQPKVETVGPDVARGCPECGVQMRADERKDVWRQTETIVADVCEEHGVWLDDTELDVLLNRARQDARRKRRAFRSRAAGNAYEEGRRF